MKAYRNYEERKYSNDFLEQLIGNNRKWGNYVWNNIKIIKKLWKRYSYEIRS